jgi:hypothetical protein
MTMPFDLISRSRMSSYRASASRRMRRTRFSKALLIAANVNVKSVNPTKRYLSLRDRRSRGQILLSCSHSPSPGACGPRTVKLYHLERRIPAQKTNIVSSIRRWHEFLAKRRARVAWVGRPQPYFRFSKAGEKQYRACVRNRRRRRSAIGKPNGASSRKPM